MNAGVSVALEGWIYGIHFTWFAYRANSVMFIFQRRFGPAADVLFSAITVLPMVWLAHPTMASPVSLYSISAVPGGQSAIKAEASAVSDCSRVTRRT